MCWNLQTSFRLGQSLSRINKVTHIHHRFRHSLATIHERKFPCFIEVHSFVGEKGRTPRESSHKSQFFLVYRIVCEYCENVRGKESIERTVNFKNSLSANLCENLSKLQFFQLSNREEGPHWHGYLGDVTFFFWKLSRGLARKLASWRSLFPFFIFWWGHWCHLNLPVSQFDHMKLSMKILLQIYATIIQFSHNWHFPVDEILSTSTILFT